VAVNCIVAPTLRVELGEVTVIDLSSDPLLQAGVAPLQVFVPPPQADSKTQTRTAKVILMSENYAALTVTCTVARIYNKATARATDLFQTA
jgi:hypothetical protein